MGATVLTEIKASAFKADNGKVYWILWNETYEKNCYPHSPHWSPFYFGDLKGALRDVFYSAASLKGGCLQSPNQKLTPAGLLQLWMCELSSPAIMPDTKRLILPEDLSKTWKSGISIDSVPKLQAALERIGRQDLANSLTDGFEISLYKDAEVFEAICGGFFMERTMPVWNVFPRHEFTGPPTGLHDLSLGYRPLKRVKVPDLPPIFRIPSQSAHDSSYVHQSQGTWRIIDGWVLFEQMVRDLAHIEVEHPINYKATIKKIEDHLLEAPALPREATCSIDKIRHLKDDPKFVEHLDEVRKTQHVVTEDEAVMAIRFPETYSYYSFPGRGISHNFISVNIPAHALPAEPLALEI